MLALDLDRGSICLVGVMAKFVVVPIDTLGTKDFTHDYLGKECVVYFGILPELPSLAKSLSTST